MANEITVRVTAKDEASKTFKQVEQNAHGLGKTLDSVGKIAGGFLAANVMAGAGQQIMGFVGQSISAASDLGESINAVNQIFGDSAKTILDWGKENANSFGLSQRAFNQLATPMGAVLKNLGFSQDEVAESTINLTKRAADMASVFNTSVPDALEAINSALRGEANPIERYGVSVNAAAVEARALAMTGKETAKSLTDQEKAAARLAIIFEQTDAVAGDLANTSDQLANKTRIQQARYEELQASIGEKLLPIQLKLVEAKMLVVETIIKLIPVLEQLYAKHYPAVAKAVQDVVAIVQQYWPQISAVIGFAIDYAVTRLKGLIQVISSVVEFVTSVVNLLIAIFHGDWQRAWQEAKDIAGAILDGIIGYVRMIFGNIPEVILELAKEAAGAAGDLAQGIFDAIVRILEQLPGKLAQIGKDAANAFLNNISVMGISAGDVAGVVGSIARKVPGFDSGGIVPGPLGSPQLVLAHGGETILPTHKTGGAGEVSVQQIFNGPVYMTDEGEAAARGRDIGFALALRGIGL
jgi:hypothetical protein